MLRENINGHGTAQSLTDALHGIDSIVKYATEESSGDIPADAVWYEAVISSICLSWHRRWMMTSHIESIGQDDFELLCRSIPKWDGRFEIVPLVPSEHVSQKERVQKPIDTSATMLQSLDGVKELVRLLVVLSLTGGEVKWFDIESTPIYRDIVAALCQAWYCRHESHEAFSAATRERRVNILIPDWGLVAPLWLVDVDWRIRLRSATRSIKEGHPGEGSVD